MKKIVLAGVVAASVALVACNDKTETTAAAVTLDNNLSKVSYGIGLNIAQNFKQQKLDIDKAAFDKGLTDGFGGAEPALKQEEIMAAMQEFQKQQQEKMLAERAAAESENKAAGEKFLADNKAKEGVVTTESGLQYKVITAAEGAKPTAEDTVVVHYRGTLINGEEFDSSYSRNQPATFGVGSVIPGWTEALQLMSVGSKYELVIPAELAYGAGGAGAKIGPNSTLVFEVELLEIAKKDETPKG